MGLPTKEKDMAFKLLKTMGVKAPNIPTNKVQIVAKIIKALGRGIDKARGTGEDMGYRNPKSRLRPVGFMLCAYLPERYKNPIGSMRKSWE